MVAEENKRPLTLVREKHVISFGKIKISHGKAAKKLKKSWKNMRFVCFFAENCKIHVVFRRKTISKTPKAIRPQATGHWDPLRNHRAEAEEARH